MKHTPLLLFYGLLMSLLSLTACPPAQKQDTQAPNHETVPDSTNPKSNRVAAEETKIEKSASDAFVPYFAISRYVAEEEVIDLYLNFDSPEKSAAWYRPSPNGPEQPLQIAELREDGCELTGRQLIWEVVFQRSDFDGAIAGMEVKPMGGKAKNYIYFSPKEGKEEVFLRSQNPKNQVIEELKINQSENQCWYRSAKNLQWIRLKTEKANDYWGYRVYFPGQTAAYQLEWNEGGYGLTCTNPDNTQQVYFGTNLY
ncbi:MAG: hypothetical protein OHK0053_17770 [Microscillaceae bacterium]